jgi:hypothetical protein
VAEGTAARRHCSRSRCCSSSCIVDHRLVTLNYKCRKEKATQTQTETAGKRPLRGNERWRNTSGCRSSSWCARPHASPPLARLGCCPRTTFGLPPPPRCDPSRVYSDRAIDWEKGGWKEREGGERERAVSVASSQESIRGEAEQRRRCVEASRCWARRARARDRANPTRYDDVASCGRLNLESDAAPTVKSLRLNPKIREKRMRWGLGLSNKMGEHKSAAMH